MVIASSSGLGSGGTVTLQGVDDAGVVVFTLGTGVSGSCSVTLSFDNFVNAGTTYEFGTAGGGPSARMFSLDMASRQVNPSISASDIQMTIALSGVVDSAVYSYAYKLN